MVAGYSYKSSQYGLALDNVAGYELVLPNGTIKHVTQEDKDLWFGLRVSRKSLIQVGETNFEWTLIAGRAQ
jgi:FAD/FMN-containing dehydrogenase